MVSLKGCLGSELIDPSLSHSFEIERRGTGFYVAAHELEHLADNFARTAHLIDFLRRLQYHSHETSSPY